MPTTASFLAPFGYQPLTNNQAWERYEAFLLDDRVDFRAEEPPGLDAQWQVFARRNSASPHLWMDAYLAAAAYANGWQLVTTDRAFTQFPGIDVLLLG